MRKKIYRTNAIGDEGQYALSQMLTASLREFSAMQSTSENWKQAFNGEIASALNKIETLPIEEADTILSLVIGGEVGGLIPGQYAKID